MKKRFLACLLLMVLISSCFSRLLIYAEFEANLDYISKTLCVNKNKPWMHCNGKCYLMKKVQQAEENEKKEAAKTHLNNLTTFFFQTAGTDIFQLPIAGYTFKISLPEYLCGYSGRYTDTIFRPPKKIV